MSRAMEHPTNDHKKVIHVRTSESFQRLNEDNYTLKMTEIKMIAEQSFSYDGFWKKRGRFLKKNPPVHLLTFSINRSIGSRLSPVKVLVADRINELGICAMEEQTFPSDVLFILVGFRHTFSFPAEKNNSVGDIMSHPISHKALL